MQVWLLSWVSPAVLMSDRGNKVLVEASDAIWFQKASSRYAPIRVEWHALPCYGIKCRCSMSIEPPSETAGTTPAARHTVCEVCSAPLEKKSPAPLKWNHPMFFLNPLPSMEVFYDWFLQCFFFFSRHYCLMSDCILNVSLPFPRGNCSRARWLIL